VVAVTTIRVSNRAAGLISNTFPGVSGRHFDENSVEFEVFETVSFSLNKETCGDRPYHSNIQPSLTVTVTAEYEPRCFY